MKIDDILGKRAIAVFAFLLSLALPFSAGAYASMNTDPQDLRTVSVVNLREFPGTSQSGWSGSANAQPNDPMSARIYFHVDNSSTESARQVRARIQIPTGTANNFTISGSIGGTNTNLATGAAGVYLNSATPQRLIIRPGAVRFFPTQASIQANQPAPLPNGQTGDEIFTSGGLFLGDIPAGWPNQGGVVIDFFVSNDTPVQNPTVMTNPATSVTYNSATINGNLTTNGATGMTSAFDWGTDSNSLINRTNSQANNGGAYSANLSGLSANTTYYFRATAQTSAGVQITPGAVLNFTTSASPAVTCPVVTTITPATGISQTGATVSGTITGTAGSFVTRWFEFGTSASNMSPNTNPITTGADGTYSDNLFGLQPSTTYYYRIVVRSSNVTGCPGSGNGLYMGQTYTFTTQSVQISCPTITTVPATNLTINGATLNATVSGLTGIGPGMWFEYGPTQSYGYTTTLQAPQNGSNSAFAGNLTPGQTYYFRAVMQAPNCALATGGQLSFTLGQMAQTLNVTTQTATNVTYNYATLNGYITASSYVNVTRWFEWGTNSSYGYRTANQTATADGYYNDSISGLSPNTTYYYRAAAQGSNGVVAYGSQVIFTTPSNNNNNNNNNYYSCPNYTVGTLTASPVDSTSAYLRGVVNSSSSSGYSYTTWIEYGPTTAYGMTTTRQYNSGGTFTQLVANLQPGVIYYYRAVAQIENTASGGGYFNNYFCNYQNIQYGNALTVTTQGQLVYQPQPQPVIIQQQITQSVITQPASSITQTAARLNGVATISNLPTNGWFEWGTSVNLASQTNPADLGNYSSNTFYANLNSLQSGQTYYFRAVIQNKQNGNILKGDILTFRTLTPVYVPPVYDYVPPVVANKTPVKLSITKEAQNVSSPNGGVGCSDAVSAKAGNTIAYYITVKNSGGAEANGVAVKDVLPDFIKFRAGSDNAKYNESTREITWSIDLRAGETKQLQVQAIVDRVTENKTVKNTASVTYGSTVKKSGTPCLIIVVEPVTLGISADKNSVNAGDTLTYTLVYRNSSGAAINAAVLRVLLPADSSVVSMEKGSLSPTDGTIVLNISSLQPNEEGRFRVSVKVGNGALSGSTLTSVLVMDYRDTVGQEQAEAHSFVPVLIGGEASPNNSVLDSAMSKQGTGLGALFGTGFLPQTLIGWLMLIVILLALFFIGRKVLNPNAGVSKTDVIIK